MSTRPLVVVTRDEPSDGRFARALEAEGVDLFALPTTAFAEAADPRPLDAALLRIAGFEWIAFTSARAVEAVVRRPVWARMWAQTPLRPRLAAVGPATAARLQEAGLRVDLLSRESGGAGLARALIEAHAGSLEGVSILWPRSDAARRELPAALATAGARLLEPVAYRTGPSRPERAAEFGRRLEAGGVDAVAFLSPSGAAGLVAALGWRDLRPLAGRTVIGSIGPTTSAALRALGAPAEVEAPRPSLKALAQAVVDRIRLRKGA